MGKSIVVRSVMVLEVYNPFQKTSNSEKLPWRGPITPTLLKERIAALIASYKKGGCNDHIPASLGFIPIPHSARVYRDGELRATWEAPTFMAF